VARKKPKSEFKTAPVIPLESRPRPAENFTKPEKPGTLLRMSEKRRKPDARDHRDLEIERLRKELQGVRSRARIEAKADFERQLQALKDFTIYFDERNRKDVDELRKEYRAALRQLWATYRRIVRGCDEGWDVPTIKAVLEGVLGDHRRRKPKTAPKKRRA
jgi:hypothetical protein